MIKANNVLCSGGPGKAASRRSVRCLFLLLLLTACVKKEEVRPDCGIDAGPCVRSAGGMTVTLDITPKPVKALRDLAFAVSLMRDSRPVGTAQVEIDLTMPGMNMGENRVRLRHEGEGSYRGRGVIVRCSSGKKLWKASVIVTDEGRVATADFLFDAP